MSVLIKRLLLFLVVLLLIVVTIGSAYVIMHRPSYDGELTLEGLKEPVEIYFDDYGIPHIYAQNEEDLYRAFGFIHAQERLFQMDILRRVGSGRLAELFGEVALPTDMLFRTLGISQVAIEDAARLRSSGSLVHNYSEAYLDGINQFIKDGYFPIEYALLGLEPEEFVLEDIYNTVGYMSFSFAQAQKSEPITQMILERYGPEYLQALDVDAFKNAEKIMNHIPKDSIENISLAIGQIMNGLPAAPFIGSNSWVIAPEKTESGKVILANDPHIGFAQPAVWYEAHLESGDFKFYGYHLAGVPFGIIGHNPHLAWGLTMFENDDIDFFFERINDQNKNQVWADSAWVDMLVREEVFQIKDGDDSTIIIKETRHGPIINDVIDPKSKDKRPVSMYWVYTKFPSQMLEATYKMSRATNLEEMKSIVPMMHAPGLNLMYGDKDGNIAWWAAGKLPIRPDHVNSKLILDGASGKDEYLGYYDFSYNPKSINPPWNYVYSANNRPDSIKGTYVPGYYLPEDRAKRIVQLLESRDKWDVEHVQEMLNDVTSSTAPDVVKEILAVIDANENNQSVIDLLSNWDGEFSTESEAAGLYAELLYGIIRGTYEDELGPDVFREFMGVHLAKRSYVPTIKDETSVWYDDINTETIETRKMIFNRAMNSLVDNHSEPKNKKWGEIHTLEHNHPLGSQKPLDKLFNVGPFEINGTNEVINNLMFKMNSSGTYKVHAGPSKRRIVDFSNVETSYSVLPTGQSGNIFSEHYMDQAELYNKGGFRKQMMNYDEILHYNKTKLVLNPQ